MKRYHFPISLSKGPLGRGPGEASRKEKRDRGRSRLEKKKLTYCVLGSIGPHMKQLLPQESLEKEGE